MNTALPPQSSTAFGDQCVGRPLILILHPHPALVSPHFTNTECAAHIERLDDSNYAGHRTGLLHLHARRLEGT